jgi:hypothetical protein
MTYDIVGIVKLGVEVEISGGGAKRRRMTKEVAASDWFSDWTLGQC